MYFFYVKTLHRLCGKDFRVTNPNCSTSIETTVLLSSFLSSTFKDRNNNVCWRQWFFPHLVLRMYPVIVTDGVKVMKLYLKLSFYMVWRERRVLESSSTIFYHRINSHHVINVRVNLLPVDVSQHLLDCIRDVITQKNLNIFYTGLSTHTCRITKIYLCLI